jgi:hypothetical protein
MALLYVDGFDAYGTTDLPKRWVAQSGTWTVTSGGRNSTNCVKSDDLGDRRLWRTLQAQRSQIIVGFAFQVTRVPLSGEWLRIAQFIGNGDAGYQIGVSAGGGIQIRAAASGNINNSGTFIASGDFPSANIQISTWYYLEWMMTFATSAGAGTCVARLNTVPIITLATGLNTKTANGNAYADTFEFGCQNGAVAPGAPGTHFMKYDDMYIADNTGSINNAFLGDVRVEAIRPTGTGTYADFTPNGAANNWDCVDEAAQDGDTTYVASSTVNHKDSYVFADLSSNPSNVMAFQVSMMARKDDAGARKISSFLRSGGSDFVSSTQFSIADNYAPWIDIWNQDPNGNIPWTGTSINALEAGVKLVA